MDRHASIILQQCEGIHFAPCQPLEHNRLAGGFSMLLVIATNRPSAEGQRRIAKKDELQMRSSTKT